MSNLVKILIVDDSALYRQSILNVLREIGGVQVVGIAKNGVEALEKITSLNPHLLTLDVQMPDMDGIAVLREIQKRRLDVKAVMVSSYTSEGAQVTTDALLEGAFDFVLKPIGNDAKTNRENLKNSLREKIEAFRDSMSNRARSESQDNHLSDSGMRVPDSDCRAILVGASTGGPETLRLILPKLPKSLPVPVLVVQHMPPKYTHSLASRLDRICQMTVNEAVDGQTAEAGHILVAPGGKHMGIREIRGKIKVALSDAPPENAVRPSVDFLLRSAAKALGNNALAVILTGMGKDGKEGCQHLKQENGFVFAQSRHDCIVYGMPKAVVESGLADRVLSIPRMAPAIVRHVKESGHPGVSSKS